MTDETVVGTTEPIKKVVSMGDRRYDTQKTIEDEEKELEELIQQQKDDAEVQEKKDKIIEGLNTRESIIYFDDFIEMHGIAKFVGICEMANLKVPDYKDENINYEELINKILTIAENSNGEIPATQKIISLINQYKND